MDTKFARLGDVCKIDKTRHDGKMLPYVGMENIESGTGQFVSEPIPMVVKSSTFRFHEVHVLYGRLRPYLNKVLLPDFEGHCSTEVFPLECSPHLNRRFLFHWLTRESTVQRINRTSTGARMPRANVNAVLDFNIPLPPLSAQERIVAILDEAFAAIATATTNAEENIQNAQELFDNELNRFFSWKGEGWTKKKLGDVCKKVDYGHTASAEGAGDGPKFLRITDIQKGSVDWHSVPVCECALNEREKYRLDRGDIVFARTGATTGKSFLIADCPSNAVFASYLIRIRSNAQVLSTYLAYFFQTPGYWEQVSRSSSGSAQPGVNATKLRNLCVPICSLPEQKRIVAILDKLSAEKQSLVGIYQRKLTALTELKQSLLHQAFTGELTGMPATFHAGSDSM